MDNDLQLHLVARELLNDAIFFLEHLPPPIYQEPQEILLGSSIGQHSRHFIEFFQCLLNQKGSQKIDYSKRQRDSLIESRPSYAKDMVLDIQEKLGKINANQTFQLNCGEHLDRSNGHWIDTTLERELLYNIDHTIHHLAIIKIGIKAALPDFELPQHFGFMPSTIQYQG